MNFKKIKPYLIVILGSAMFGISVNLFVVSLNLFSGGLLGVAQVIRSIIQMFSPNTVANFDVSGLIYAALNIPLYIMAYKTLSHRFFYLSLVSTIVQTVTLTLCPIPTELIFNDMLVSIIVGGMIGGIGIGLCLKEGGSGGGFDILGVYYALKVKSGSVGQLSLILNGCVFAICAVLFNFQTAVYSVIYVFIFSFALDKVHLQNIATHCMIFTQNRQIKKDIITKLNRGVTYWQGMGAYTDTSMDILVTIISKYEVNNLRRMILEMDPKAFIIVSEGLQISGNYEKRLV